MGFELLTGETVDFWAKTLPFLEKKGSLVKWARHLPSVGQTQGPTRVPRGKPRRVLSGFPYRFVLCVLSNIKISPKQHKFAGEVESLQNKLANLFSPSTLNLQKYSGSVAVVAFMYLSADSASPSHRFARLSKSILLYKSLIVKPTLNDMF